MTSGGVSTAAMTKATDDEIAALFAQLFRGQDADPPQQRQHDRQLERDAEGEDQRHHQRQIFADFRQQRDLRGFGPPTCCMPSEKRISIGSTTK